MMLKRHFQIIAKIDKSDELCKISNNQYPQFSPMRMTVWRWAGKLLRVKWT